MLKKLFYWLWPPYEAYLARLWLDERIDKSNERIKTLDDELNKILNKSKKIPVDIEALAKLTFEAENKRRDSIESKALTFISNFSVAVSIASVLPTLFSGKSELPNLFLLILGGIYIFGVIHLFTAVYWAVEARRIEGLAVPNVDDYMSFIQNGKWEIRDRIFLYIRQSRFNEPIISKKTNALSVAETMFIRGLFFVGVATIASGISGYFFNSKHEIGCVIPNVVNMDVSVAKYMLLELGLNPVLTSEFNLSVDYGAVVSQNLAAGTVIKPCNQDIVISVSLGAIPTVIPSPAPTSLPTSTTISPQKP